MNTYLFRILSISHLNKYSTWYVNIITNALSRPKNRKQAKNLFEYVEEHHVFPDCFCSEEEAKDKENLVFLTAKEHYICHLLLVKMMNTSENKSKMAFAIHMFINGASNTHHQRHSTFNSRIYDFIKKEHAIALSLSKKGKSHTLEHSAAISKAKKGKSINISPAFLEARARLIGTKASPETIEKKKKPNVKNGKPISVEGTVYACMGFACQALGLKPQTLWARIKASTFPTYFYIT